MKINLLLLIPIVIVIIVLIYNFFDFDQINVWILNRLVILRGVLAPHCGWFMVSDVLLPNDGSGIKTYNNFKNKYGDFAPSYMYGEKIYTVTNNKYIKIIFDNSPDLFSVGKLKYKFFKSFMSKNVGVSTGCPWKRRRKINEVALSTDKLPLYSNMYNNIIRNKIKKWNKKKELGFKDFANFGKKIVKKIVFNNDKIDDKIFKIFSEANTIEAFSNPNFKIDEKIYNNYINVINDNIENPKPNSLIKLCLTVSNNKEEIQHQIPHFIFPIAGLFITTIPRLLLLLCNHRNIFKKVINEIYSVNNSTSEEINKLTYLRKCILETLRLNNPVITTFRTLTKDYKFDNKYSFKKGDQFLILNNPVLREKEYFKKPNEFIPSRWTLKMEKSYYAISFNQGPQKCPGKEFAIYLAQSFIYNFIKVNKIGINKDIKSEKIKTKNIPQVINPCTIKLYLSKVSI